jgi:Fe-S cluster biogenesis protein NfuA|tara:strand:- start:458 stop:715 length:258 start_codon:yes stop_codon:yes gene_type:complete
MSKHEDDSNKKLYTEVQSIIELIRPSIQADGGDIELVSVDDLGVVSIRFLGACIGCPSLNMTLQSTIESTLKKRLEDVSAVQAVE